MKALAKSDDNPGGVDPATLGGVFKSCEASVVRRGILETGLRIDGRNVDTEARLSVQSVGGPFDRFQLRLPPGASLVSSNLFGVQLTDMVD